MREILPCSQCAEDSAHYNAYGFNESIFAGEIFCRASNLARLFRASAYPGLSRSATVTFFYRLGNSAHLCQSGSQVIMRRSRRWAHPQRLLEVLYCFRSSAGLDQGVGQIVVRLGITGIDPQRLLELIYCL